MSAPRSGDGVVTVKDPTGRHLKVPTWMCSAPASRWTLSADVAITVRALLALVELLALRLGKTLPGGALNDDSRGAPGPPRPAGGDDAATTAEGPPSQRASKRTANAGESPGTAPDGADGSARRAGAGRPVRSESGACPTATAGARADRADGGGVERPRGAARRARRVDGRSDDRCLPRTPRAGRSRR